MLYKRGDYEQALTLLSKSAAKCLDNAEMQFHLGMAHYMMGHEEAALTALRQASNE
jgi:Flp pilus assembly protein TadD